MVIKDNSGKPFYPAPEEVVNLCVLKVVQQEGKISMRDVEMLLLFNFSLGKNPNPKCSPSQSYGFRTEEDLTFFLLKHG